VPLNGDDSFPDSPEKPTSGSGSDREMDLLQYHAPSIRNLFSEFLHSPSPTCTSVGDFSSCSSNTAVSPVPDETLLTSSAELLSGAPDRNLAQADRQSHAAAKPSRIQLQLNPTKIILRLKGPKLGKSNQEKEEEGLME
jgi:hypothetical protein